MSPVLKWKSIRGLVEVEPMHSGLSQSERWDMKFCRKTANFGVYFVTFYISRGVLSRKFHEETNGTTFRTSKFCIDGVTSVQSFQIFCDLCD